MVPLTPRPTRESLRLPYVPTLNFTIRSSTSFFLCYYPYPLVGYNLDLNAKSKTWFELRFIEKQLSFIGIQEFDIKSFFVRPTQFDVKNNVESQLVISVFNGSQFNILNSSEYLSLIEILIFDAVQNNLDIEFNNTVFVTTIPVFSISRFIETIALINFAKLQLIESARRFESRITITVIR